MKKSVRMERLERSYRLREDTSLLNYTTSDFHYMLKFWLFKEKEMSVLYFYQTLMKRVILYEDYKRMKEDNKLTESYKQYNLTEGDIVVEDYKGGLVSIPEDIWQNIRVHDIPRETFIELYKFIIYHEKRGYLEVYKREMKKASKGDKADAKVGGFFVMEAKLGYYEYLKVELIRLTRLIGALSDEERKYILYAGLDTYKDEEFKQELDKVSDKFYKNYDKEINNKVIDEWYQVVNVMNIEEDNRVIIKGV